MNIATPTRPSVLPSESSLTELLSLRDWCRFVPESAGLSLLILTLLAWFPEASTSRLLPHPLWLPVLLMSGQYGIVGGLFATLAASVTLFASGLPAWSATQDFYGYAGTMAAQPCAWLATVLLLGGLRTLHMHQHGNIQERLAETEVIAADLAEGLEEAIAEIANLERRIAGDSRTVATIMSQLANIDTTDRASVIASFAEIVRLSVRATNFSIYLRTETGYEPYVVVEDGTRVPAAAAGQPPAFLLADAMRHHHDDGAADEPGCGGAVPFGDFIRRTAQERPLGVVLCNRLEPSQQPAIARRRLREVCRIMAALVVIHPESSTGAVRHVTV